MRPISVTVDALLNTATVGGGFFTGRYTGLTDEVESGTRFDPTKNQGQVCTLCSAIHD